MKASLASPTYGRQITRVWFPPPSEDCRKITAQNAIDAAAEVGMELAQPDPRSAWLVDGQGRRVFWWYAGEDLVYSTFLSVPEESTHGHSFTI